MAELLVVTGAGASKNLAVEGHAMPLMEDWSKALCAALDDIATGLAKECGFSLDDDGQKFEENLGRLLNWEEAQPLYEGFARLGNEGFTDEKPGYKQARELIRSRITEIKRVLRVTLYDQFGLKQVDDKKAKKAYEALLDALGSPSVIFATTNYDRSAERAFNGLGYQTDNGFTGGQGRSWQLDPVGMIDRRAKKIPIIHLHGAVGWYQAEGAVEDHPADKPLNDSLGAPVVLYPDPNKTPTRDAFVSQLWTEFNTAIDIVDAVLVIGHSLHDPSLVDALRRAAASKPTAVTYMTGPDKTRVEAEVPEATPVRLAFGPDAKIPKPLRSLLAFPK